MHVSRNGMLILTTRFTHPGGDLPFWRSWLQHASVQTSSQTFAVTFCTVDTQDPHKCQSPRRSEYFIPDIELPSEPNQLLDSIQLELIGPDITVDSQSQPQVLTMRAIVRVHLTNPEAEVSTSRLTKLNLWSGRIEFA
jgi:hypothetical protein